MKKIDFFKSFYLSFDKLKELQRDYLFQALLKIKNSFQKWCFI